jgi:hypothetical protein
LLILGAEEQERNKEEAEKAELVGRIGELRSKYQVAHVQQHIRDDPESLCSELKMLLPAVGISFTTS